MILQVSVITLVVATLVTTAMFFWFKKLSKLEIPGYAPTRSHFIFGSKGTVLCIPWNKIDAFRYDASGTIVITVGTNTYYAYSTRENVTNIAQHMTTRC